MDRIAQETNIDPVEVRRRNLIAPASFPYTTVLGGHYDSGNYQATLEKVVEMGNYTGWRAKQQEMRQQDNSRMQRVRHQLSSTLRWMHWLRWVFALLAYYERLGLSVVRDERGKEDGTAGPEYQDRCKTLSLGSRF